MIEVEDSCEPGAAERERIPMCRVSPYCAPDNITFLRGKYARDFHLLCSRAVVKVGPRRADINCREPFFKIGASLSFLSVFVVGRNLTVVEWTVYWDYFIFPWK